MKEINLLLPKVQTMANEFLAKCKAQGITVGITSTYRSDEEQNALYAQGRTTPGNVVTNAKAGQSMHNWKCAIDFCPITNDNYNWNDKALFYKVGNIGKSCGFEWGGDWTSFLDLPHLQYTAGYSLEDFQMHRVDFSKFNDNTPVKPVVTAPTQVRHIFTIPLVYGMVNNDDVKALQDILITEGYLASKSTGNYYDMTAAAVMAFQLACHIAPDKEIKALGGKRVGQLTINVLNS
jgi:peptidoglycan L-alanyl-D-glutamate endopeptidase CwlK